MNLLQVYSTYETLGDNITSLNANAMVQPMKPLVLPQPINEERCNFNCVGFILPTRQSHASRNAPHSSQANVDFVNQIWSPGNLSHANTTRCFLLQFRSVYIPSTIFTFYLYILYDHTKQLLCKNVKLSWRLSIKNVIPSHYFVKLSRCSVIVSNGLTRMAAKRFSEYS